MKNNWKEELREQIYQVGLMGMRYMKDDCKKEDCLIIQKELLEKVESILEQQKKELVEKVRLNCFLVDDVDNQRRDVPCIEYVKLKDIIENHVILR